MGESIERYFIAGELMEDVAVFGTVIVQHSTYSASVAVSDAVLGKLAGR
jgi:hypothetical protein